MNKHEIQNKIDNIQSKIDELQHKQNELQEKAIKLDKEQNKLKMKLQLLGDIRWKAKGHSPYYMVGYHGYILKQIEEFTSFDDWNYNTGNYFKTEQEAQDYKDNLMTKQKLKDLALSLNNGVGIDWEDGSQTKYIIAYDNNTKELFSGCAYRDKFLNPVYCLDENFLDIALEEIGEDSLIKLIKSGV